MKLDDKVLYADILQCKRKNGKVYYEDEYAILIQSPTSHIFYCASLDAEHAEKMLETLPQDMEMLVAHDLYTDQGLNKRNLFCDLRCYHSAYLKEKDMEVELPQGYIIKQATIEDIDYMYSLYKKSMPHIASPQYFIPCIKDGMLKVEFNHQICGFIGTHDEDSIGMLEIDQEHRHKGLAVALIHAMVNQQKNRGRIPYGEIIDDNIASLHLQSKAGLEVSPKLTYWYFQ